MYYPVILALGVFLFATLHGVMAIPHLKSLIKERIGTKAYGPFFGIASIGVLAIIVSGWRGSESVVVYESQAWGWYINYLLNFIGFVCLGIFLFRGRLRQRLRHPMALATIFWAVGHLFSNGDIRSLVLFGGLALISAAHIFVANANGIRPSGEVRMGHDGLSLIFGAAMYGIMTQLHPALIGVPIFVLTR